jgi:hypothetical protein
VFRTTCSGVIGTIAKNEFDNAFRQWMDRCQKYVRISCDKAKKSPEIMVFLKWFRITVILPCTFVSNHTLLPFINKNVQSYNLPVHYRKMEWIISG